MPDQTLPTNLTIGLRPESPPPDPPPDFTVRSILEDAAPTESPEPMPYPEGFREPEPSEGRGFWATHAPVWAGGDVYETWNAEDEARFQPTYAKWAVRYGLDPDPDAPDQTKDWRREFKEGRRPTEADRKPVKASARPPGWTPAHEAKFKQWYATAAAQTGINPDADAPDQKYNYRYAFASGAWPDADGHWPSKFKAADHPNRYVQEGLDTIDSITGQALSPERRPSPAETEGLSLFELATQGAKPTGLTRSPEIPAPGDSLWAQVHNRKRQLEALPKDAWRPKNALARALVDTAFLGKDPAAETARFLGLADRALEIGAAGSNAAKKFDTKLRAVASEPDKQKQRTLLKAALKGADADDGTKSGLITRAVADIVGAGMQLTPVDYALRVLASGSAAAGAATKKIPERDVRMIHSVRNALTGSTALRRERPLPVAAEARDWAPDVTEDDPHTRYRNPTALQRAENRQRGEAVVAGAKELVKLAPLDEQPTVADALVERGFQMGPGEKLSWLVGADPAFLDDLSGLPALAGLAKAGVMAAATIPRRATRALARTAAERSAPSAVKAVMSRFRGRAMTGEALHKLVDQTAGAEGVAGRMSDWLGERWETPVTRQEFADELINDAARRRTTASAPGVQTNEQNLATPTPPAAAQAAPAAPAARQGAVPPAPGTTPVPPGMIRGYHYTNALDDVERRGLDMTKARGEGYGEPNAIWFSTTKPSDGKDYIEVHLDPDEVTHGGPLYRGDDKASKAGRVKVDEFNQGSHDFATSVRQIPPERIVTTHRPWHDRYRYITRPDNTVLREEILSGGLGDLLDDPEYGPAIDAFKAEQRAVSQAPKLEYTSNEPVFLPPMRAKPDPVDFIVERDKSPRRGYLSELAPDDLRGKKLYLSEDGTVGGALGPDGNISNLFNNSQTPGAGSELLMQMLADGGKTAEAFDGYLTHLYAQFGMHEVGRMEFDPAVAPKGWNYAKDDHPDVVFLARTREAGNFDDIRARLGDESQWTDPREPGDTYFTDYREGQRSATAAVEQRRAAPGGGAPGVLRADPGQGVGGEARAPGVGGGPGAGRADATGAVTVAASDAPADNVRAGRAVSDPGAGGRGGVGVSTEAPVPLERARNWPNHDPQARDVTNDYNVRQGLPPVNYDVVPLDKALARRVADAFEALPVDDSANPAVRAAYEAFVTETRAQWDHIKEQGYELLPWDREGQPYANSHEMVEDVAKNKRLYFFRGGDPHPFLDTVDPATGFSSNEMFRAAHDFRHASGGWGFGGYGEENVFNTHAQGYSPLARRAMATETRGPNSWVNFGRQNFNADGTRKLIPAADRPFAPQKAALLPDEFVFSADELAALRKTEEAAPIKPTATEHFDAAEQAYPQLAVTERNVKNTTRPRDTVYAGDTVDGLQVRTHVPNTDSIEASFHADEFETLPGIRKVPLSELDTTPYRTVDDARRVDTLASQIEASGEISPVIVVRDSEGVYTLEGSHRARAAAKLGKTDVPALVVVHYDDGVAVDAARAAATEPAGPRTIQFTRNTESATKHGDFGEAYGQHLEPAGRYINEIDPSADLTKPPEKGWERGTVTFQNPLVIDWGKGGLYSDPSNWKRVLSERYGGKTGEALSKAIKADGYDGIITMDKGATSEIVDLTGGRSGGITPGTAAKLAVAGTAAAVADDDDGTGALLGAAVLGGKSGARLAATAKTAALTARKAAKTARVARKAERTLGDVLQTLEGAYVTPDRVRKALATVNPAEVRARGLEPWLEAYGTKPIPRAELVANLSGSETARVMDQLKGGAFTQKRAREVVTSVLGPDAVAERGLDKWFKKKRKNPLTRAQIEAELWKTEPGAPTPLTPTLADAEAQAQTTFGRGLEDLNDKELAKLVRATAGEDALFLMPPGAREGWVKKQAKALAESVETGVLDRTRPVIQGAQDPTEAMRIAEDYARTGDDAARDAALEAYPESVRAAVEDYGVAQRRLDTLFGARGLRKDPIDGNLISTNVITSKKAKPQTAMRETNLESFPEGSEIEANTAKLMLESGLLTDAEKAAATTPRQVLRASIDAMKRNLRALYEAYPEEWRERSRAWYQGAHRLAGEMAEEFGTTREQVAGVMASLSPTKDWFQNVELARRILTRVREFEKSPPVFTEALYGRFAEKMHEGTGFAIQKTKAERTAAGKKFTSADERKIRTKRAKKIEKIRDLIGESWEDGNIKTKAYIFRAMEGLDFPDGQTFSVISPEGDIVRTATKKAVKGKAPESHKLVHQSYKFIGNAIEIAEMAPNTPFAQVMERVSAKLGGEHKVRSFYNNIINPWDKRSVTIDTHADAAAWLRPFSSKSAPVKQSMGGAGASKSATTGVSGTNGVIAQAYFELADEMKLARPSELQSVTWEAVRSLFEPSHKKVGGKAFTAIEDLHNQYISGKISHDKFFRFLKNTLRNADSHASGFRAPDWVTRPPSDKGRLVAGGVSPRDPVFSAGPGNHLSDTEGLAGAGAP